MRHFKVTVSCQAVETSMMVCLDKDLQRDKIHNICKACVKDNYGISITAIRLRHNDTTKWISLEQMVQELVNLKLYKIRLVKKPIYGVKTNHGQLIDTPTSIKPTDVIIRHFSGHPSSVYITLKPSADYLKIDFDIFAAALNKQDLKLAFRGTYDGIAADFPDNAIDKTARIVNNKIDISWNEIATQYETVQEKVEL